MSSDSAGPLGRFHHRLKTVGGWRCHSPEPSVFYWRSSHGHWARVDGAGTTYLGTHPPEQVQSPPPVAESVGEQHIRALLAG